MAPKMKTKTRLELLTQSDEQKNVDQQLHQASVDKLNLERDILETKSKVKQLQAELIMLKSAPVLSAADVISTMNALKGYEEGLVLLNQLKEELFPST